MQEKLYLKRKQSTHPKKLSPLSVHSQCVKVQMCSDLWCVDLHQVLQLAGVACTGTAAVGFHIHVDTAVAEDEARGGQHGGVGVGPVAQWTCPAVQVTGLQLQGWRRGQAGEGLHSARTL